MTDDRQFNSEGDLVLVHYQDKPACYARIETVEPDIKKDWYQVTLLLLTIPDQTVTWILREEYINGASFTMGGVPMRLEGLRKVTAGKSRENTDQSVNRKGKDKSPKVLPFKKTIKSALGC